jgi:hypothetical protein
MLNRLKDTFQSATIVYSMESATIAYNKPIIF